MKYVLLSIFIFAMLSVALTGLSAPAKNLCKSGVGGYCVNLAAVAVPGLEFLGETPGDAGGLIARLFVFGLSLVGISALIMFVFAGVVYMTAGDSQSRVNQAKSMMGNAVFGLVLALISYLILYTINPDIVTKGFPSPTTISPSPQRSDVNAGICNDPNDPRCPIYAPSTSSEYWVCPATTGVQYAGQATCNANCTAGPCDKKTRPVPKPAAPPVRGSGTEG